MKKRCRFMSKIYDRSLTAELASREAYEALTPDVIDELVGKGVPEQDLKSLAREGYKFYRSTGALVGPSTRGR